MEEHMNMRVPAPISAEHHECQLELERAATAGGMTGAAAKEAARLLNDHYVKEAAFALPPLALLKRLAKGESDDAMPEAEKLTDQLAAEMPEMLKDHYAIVQALNRMSDAADSEGLPEYLRLAEKLIAQSRMREDVLYPAALLVGRYLRLANQGRVC
jgi:hypothetical protein